MPASDLLTRTTRVGRFNNNALLQASMVHMVTYTGSHINLKKNVEKKMKNSSSLRYPGMEVDLHVRNLLDIK